MKKIIFKKAIFNEENIILLKNNQDIKICIEDIDYIDYVKPTIFNWLSVMYLGGTPPNLMMIHLKKKIEGTKLYAIKVKYKHIYKLPDVYKSFIGVF